MASTDLIARLRSGLRRGSVHAADALLYEHWLGQERWPLISVAPALLIGVAPQAWSDYLDQHDLQAAAAELSARLMRDLAATADASVSPLQLRAWSQAQRVALPAVAEQVLAFIARTVPRLVAEASVMTVPAALSRDKEAVLGAALALVTRFTEDCLDEARMFDGRRIARLMLAQAALWFPDGPPAMDEPAIAALVEHYISGF